ncbi:MAG: energy transducer TonB [Flavobacteriaceae bacterium]
MQSGSKQTIETKFKVGKDGSLTQMEAFSVYPELNEEALKILKSVGKLAPREVNGQYVEQYISLPIVFTVESAESRMHRLRKEARRKEN